MPTSTPRGPVGGLACLSLPSAVCYRPTNTGGVHAREVDSNWVDHGRSNSSPLPFSLSLSPHSDSPSRFTSRLEPYFSHGPSIAATDTIMN